MIFRVKAPAQAHTIINTLNESGFQAFIVGGCVRDAILGLEPYDFDITTSAKPDEIKNVLRKYNVIETGIKHGTVTVIINHRPFEVTTFRTDGEYNDNRHPDSVRFVNDIEGDLNRRDFTINAMAHDLKKNSKVIDFFGGLDDIKNRCIRCVGDPKKRFEEDALRILRALRFAATLGFDIEEDTAKAIHVKRDLLKNISSERIFSEFKQLICGKNAVSILRDFRDVIAVFIPEIEAMFDFNQNNTHHKYDVYEHILHSIENIDNEVDLKLTMFFHDIGKPFVYAEEIDDNKNVIGHFYNHAKKSEEIVGNIFNRLKSDNHLKSTVKLLVRTHGDELALTKKSVRRKLNKMNEDNLRKLLKVKRADVLSQADRCRESRLKFLAEYESLLDEVIKKSECFCIKDLAIDGKDLIEKGYAGKELGEMINVILNEVIDGNLENDRDVILEYIDDFNSI